MSVHQSIPLNYDTIKMRWKEQYVTAGLNQKNITVHPKGTLAGFRVVPVGGWNVEVQMDPSLGLSVANVLETTGGKFSVGLLEPTNILVDLSVQAGLTVFFALDAQYVIGSNTTAQVKVVDAAELASNLDLVVFAKVNVPGGPPVLASHVNHGYRQAAGDSTPVEAFPHFNLINNPTFEANTASGWTNNGFDTAAASTDFAHTGTYSLKLTKAVAGTPFITTGGMAVVPGRLYRASAWMRTSGGGIVGGSGAKLQVSWYDASDVLIGSVVDVETALSGAPVSPFWFERKLEVTAPALAFYAKVRVFFDTCSGTLYVDDVEFSTHYHDQMAQSAVFGGPTVSADAYHTHVSSGLYAGGGNWADGTTNPATTVEGQLDKIITDLAGASGAPKIGNAPSKILSNVFVNTVPNTPSIDATGAGSGGGVIGRGGATSGHGVQGIAGGPNGSGVIGTGAGGGVGGAFVGAGAVMPAYSGQGAVAAGASTGSPTGFFALGGGPNGYGVHGRAQGIGAGVYGEGAVASNSAGVIGTGYGTEPGVSGSAATGPGVRGTGTGTGVGVWGIGGTNTSTGGPTAGVTPAPAPGLGGYFVGATGTGGGDGIFSIARMGVGSTTPRSGINAVGAYSQTTGVTSGAGGYMVGGSSTVGNANGGNGLQVYGGDPFGTGQAGYGAYVQAGAGASGAGQVGLYAVGTGWYAGLRGDGGPNGGMGVYGVGFGGGSGHVGHGSTSGGYGIYGESHTAGWEGVWGQGKGAGAGVVGRGDQAGVGSTTVNAKGVHALGGPANPAAGALAMGGTGVLAYGHDDYLYPSTTFGDYYMGIGGPGVWSYGGAGRYGGHGIDARAGIGYGGGFGAGVSGFGGIFTGGAGNDNTTGNAVSGHGAWGHGGYGSGFTEGGHGVVGQNGGSDDPNTPGYAFYAYSGHIKLNGGNPAASANVGANVLTASSTVKAWAVINQNLGVASVLAGFNVSACTWDAAHQEFYLTCPQPITAGWTCLVGANADVGAFHIFAAYGWNNVAFAGSTTIGGGRTNFAGVGNQKFTIIVLGLQ